jgi:hypothetical protein
MREDQQTIDYMTRFDQLQTRFIDEPREAVREAGTLVREAVDRLFNGDQDTEQLRRLMQGYRDLLTRLDDGGGRAAERFPTSSRGQVVDSGPGTTAPADGVVGRGDTEGLRERGTDDGGITEASDRP